MSTRITDYVMRDRTTKEVANVLRGIADRMEEDPRSIYAFVVAVMDNPTVVPGITSENMIGLSCYGSEMALKSLRDAVDTAVREFIVD